MMVGFAILLFMLFGWFGTVIRENEAGAYNEQVDLSFRWGMFWFIFSEVMFFAAFFGALFYARQYSIPWLSGEGDGVATNTFLWSGFEGSWPHAANGPGNVGGEIYKPMPAWGLPAINTAILLASGATLTWAHHALKANHRAQLIIGLFLTVALGAQFLWCLQGVEYIEAYQHLGLTLGSGIYGTTFLYADRVSRHARYDRCDYSGGYFISLYRRTFLTEPAFRIRGGRMVLALRRRCVAGVIYICVLVVRFSADFIIF